MVQRRKRLEEKGDGLAIYEGASQQVEPSMGRQRQQTRTVGRVERVESWGGAGE